MALSACAAGVLCLTTPVAAAEVFRECEDLYFGFRAAPDFEAAYACFEAKVGEAGDVAARDPLRAYGPLVLMRLNGHGAIAIELKEASRLLAAWQKVEPRASEQRLFLQRVVLERKSGLGPTDPPPIEFCALPGDAAFEARCGEIRRRRGDGERERMLRELREQVPEAVRPALGRLVFAFGGYVEQEVERSARAQALDRDSKEAAGSQRRRVQSHFDAAVRDVLVDRSVPAASRSDATRKERDLDRAFEADRTERRAAFEAFEKALPDSAASYARARRKYDDAARLSRATWERYRDAWIEVARLAVGESGNADAAAASVRHLLAEQRMVELRSE